MASSEPSALAVLETESGFQVLVTSSGSDRLFTFDLPSADGVTIAAPASQVPIIAGTSSLDGRSLVVVVTLLAGGSDGGQLPRLGAGPRRGRSSDLPDHRRRDRGGGGILVPCRAGIHRRRPGGRRPAEPLARATPEEQPFDEAAQTALPQGRSGPPTGRTPGEDTPATGEAEAPRCCAPAEPAPFPGPREDKSRNLTWLDAAFQDVGLGWQMNSSDADEANPDSRRATTAGWP